MRDLTIEVLEILENDSRITNDQLAKMLNVSLEEINALITQLENDKIIVKHQTVINWEKIPSSNKITALIELNIIPQRGVGFDKVAERIYRFPQVKSLYLMSGSYDLCVLVEGNTMQDISNFVAERLACLEEVRGTKTNFVMRQYKKDGVIFNDEEVDRRLVVMP